MATAAQLQANRANARLSTGPTSDAGKARSSRNRLSHGFRSTSVLLPGDDPAEYEALLEELTTHFEPEDLTEQRYVREMADAEWRLRRVRLYEQRILETYIGNIMDDNPDMDPIEAQVQAFEKAHSQTALSACIRYGNQYQRQYDRAYQGLLSTRERVSRHRSREALTALHTYMAVPTPEPKSARGSALPFEPNFPAPALDRGANLPPALRSSARSL